MATDDYVDVGDAPSLTFTEEITVACWIKVHQFDRNWSAIVTKGDDWVLARTRDDNRVAFLCLGLTGGGWPEVYSGDVNDGNWHHIAGVYDGAQLCLYQDGSRVDSKTLRGQINSNWSRVLIGENEQAPQPLLEWSDRRCTALQPAAPRRGDWRSGGGDAAGAAATAACSPRRNRHRSRQPHRSPLAVRHRPQPGGLQHLSRRAPPRAPLPSSTTRRTRSRSTATSSAPTTGRTITASSRWPSVAAGNPSLRRSSRPPPMR